MEKPEEESKLPTDKNQQVEKTDDKSDGLLESINDTKDEIVDSISDKKNEIVNSMKENKKELSESIQKKKAGISKSIDSGIKKTKSFFKKLLIIGILLSIISFAFYLVYANWTYSEGVRTGELIKISKKGYVFKTHEGQLKLGGIDLENPDIGLSDTWSFSVTDEVIINQLEKRQGEEVILRYKQINNAMPWQGDTNYFVYDVVE